MSTSRPVGTGETYCHCGQADREPSDAEVDAFREEWERADAEGDAGNRVRRGLRAAQEAHRV